MSTGSGLFSDKRAHKPHLVEGKGGVAGEVEDVRKDVQVTLEPMAALTVEEFTNPALADVDGLEAATPCTVAPRTVTSFLAPGQAALAAYPRTITFTTSGTTPADAPANAVVTTKDANGDTQTETVLVPQTASTTSSVKCAGELVSVAYAAADGTDASVSIGFGPVLGLGKKAKSRAGAVNVVNEIEAGAKVTTGTFVDAVTSPPNGSYAPATAPDGSNDYALVYEYDPTA